MSKVHEVLSQLTLAVKRAHEEVGMQRGHGFDSHVYRVASLALEFGNELGVGVLAAAAGLCHNADRLLAKQRDIGRRAVPAADVEALIRTWLAVTVLKPDEQNRIVTAVLNHEKPNGDKDDPVQIALQDADRVVNAALDVVIRAAQLQPDLPVIDFGLLLSDKRGKYNSRETIVADLVDCLDWDKSGPFQVRTEGAKKMIRSRVLYLADYLHRYIDQLGEEGALPYPFAEAETSAPADVTT